MERNYLPEITGFISRPRIDALMRKALGYATVLVLAGPGFGKTLSVAHSLKNADVRLAWVRASNTRTSASDFWTDLVKAVAREQPRLATKLEKLGFPDTPGGFEQFREIAEAAVKDGPQYVCVVDNYERITDESIIRFLNSLSDCGLPNFTLFLLCNAMLPFSDALPAAGLLRITDENLAFSLDEARMMYEQYGMRATPRILEWAMRVTGGWPLGLRLVCESNPEAPEDYSSRSPVQMVADLFEQHYFLNYPMDVQTRLVLLSLLPQFSLDMIEPAQGTPKEVFADILMKHPFISCDYSNGLYVLQPMYHDFLRHRQPLLSMEQRMVTMNHAGRWFLEHDMLNEAMDCFWEAADYDGYLTAVGRLPRVRKPADITGRILQRLEQIPAHYADAHPVVEMSMAFMHLNAAGLHRGRELLLNVAARLEVAPQTEESRVMLADSYAVLADIATCLNEDTGLAWMQKAFALAPNGAHIHTPELMSIGSNEVFFLPSGEAGQLERMVEYFFEYAKYADRVKNGCGHGYEYLFAGEAAYYRGNMDHAAAMFNSAMMKAQLTAQHDIICNALWNLGRIELYYGNHKNALALLAEIEAYVNENDLVGLHELRDCITAYFCIRLEDLDGVPAWFGNPMAGPDVMPLDIARKHLTSAGYLQLKGENAKAYAVLLQLESRIGNRGCWSERLRICVLKALHYMNTGQPQAFAREFEKLYGMIYANDLKQSLSGHGRRAMAMLDYLRKLGATGYDEAWLEVVYEDAASMAKRLQAMRAAYKDGGRGYRSAISLTKRESETLHYLVQGLTQKEIAKLMGISDNAVKKHVSKIYFKLGAVNRADAVHIATVNGLVDVISG